MANLSPGEIAGIIVGCVAAYFVVILLGVHSRPSYGDEVWGKSSVHHRWYRCYPADPYLSPYATPYARRGRGRGRDHAHVAPWGSLSPIGDAPARVREVKPAPRGGQVGIHHISIMDVNTDGSLG